MCFEFVSFRIKEIPDRENKILLSIHHTFFLHFFFAPGETQLLEKRSTRATNFNKSDSWELSTFLTSLHFFLISTVTRNRKEGAEAEGKRSIRWWGRVIGSKTL